MEFLVFCPTVFSCLNTFLSSLMPVYLHTSIKYHCALTKSLQSCLTLCDPMDSSPPGSSVHGILQARILGWVAMPSCRGSSQPRDWTQVFYTSPALAGGFFTTSATMKISFIENCLPECKHTHTCLYWNFKHRCSYLYDALARRVTGGPAYSWIPEMTDM